MTVINPSSISGITSITLPSGDGNVLTIHTNDGTERFRIDSSGNVKVGSACTISPDGDVFFTGVTTATTFTGAHSGSGANLTNLPAANVTGTLPAISGANLTNLPAANLTGTLPALDGSNLTGVAATDNVRTGILDVAGIATFRDNVNVPNINGGQIGGRRNIIINGAMNIAQRGTSSTSSSYQTVDRIIHTGTGWDEAMTQSQSDVASGTTPYTLGFRKAFKIQNGNQTSGAGASDELGIRYSIEAQDVANSGWNYTSSSSNITLSFWVKSSVAQNFYAYLLSMDGTIQRYAFETGALSADTWTKVTKTIPGNSNITIDNNTGEGFRIEWRLFAGTDFTDSGVSLNTWAAFASGTRTPDSTSTWYTTNDATFELTGLQLEVGSQATAFEHRSFAEEALLCKRYFQQIIGNGDLVMFGSGRASGTSNALVPIQLAVPLRASPTLPTIAYSGWGISNAHTVTSYPTVQSFNTTDNQLNLDFGGLSGNLTNGRVATISSNSGSTLTMDAEL